MANAQVQRPMQGLRARALDEARRFALVLVYVWAILALFALHRKLLQPQYDLAEGQAFAFFNALVLGKVIYFAERLHLAENLRGKPFIYPILFKSAVFSLLLICFSLVEETVMGFLRGRTVSDNVMHVGSSGPGTVLIAIIVFVVLMPFFALREFASEIGDKRLFELFFVRRGGELRGDLQQD